MVMARKTYKLQRWWKGSPFKRSRTGKWETIKTSKNKVKIKDSYKGWTKQLDGDFRIKTPSGKVTAQKKTRLYRMVHKKPKSKI